MAPTAALLRSSLEIHFDFTNAPDFKFRDGNGDNLYEVTVTISDSVNTGATLYVVEVADLNDETPGWLPMGANRNRE